MRQSLYDQVRFFCFLDEPLAPADALIYYGILADTRILTYHSNVIVEAVNHGDCMTACNQLWVCEMFVWKQTELKCEIGFVNFGDFVNHIMVSVGGSYGMMLESDIGSRLYYKM